MAPHFGDLPSSVLRHILLTATTHDTTSVDSRLSDFPGLYYKLVTSRHDDLLRHAATCACVCREWWRVVADSVEYGRGLLGKKLKFRFLENRARVLKGIVIRLKQKDAVLDLADFNIGDPGMAALGAALQAMATIPFTRLCMARSGMTGAGFAGLVPALTNGRWIGQNPPAVRRWILAHPVSSSGLLELDLHDNPGLGNAGLVALATALPHLGNLRRLSFSNSGCDDDGYVALSARLPTLGRLRELHCSNNQAVSARGWAALASVLPSLRSLRELWAMNTIGWDGRTRGAHWVGAEGVAALAAAVPHCARLQVLQIEARPVKLSDQVTLYRRRGAEWGALGAAVEQIIHRRPVAYASLSESSSSDSSDEFSSSEEWNSEDELSPDEENLRSVCQRDLSDYDLSPLPAPCLSPAACSPRARQFVWT
eukprot:COSAG06_NODE_8296_length_2210_cov_47.281074_2_plen_425_part_00